MRGQLGAFFGWSVYLTRSSQPENVVTDEWDNDTGAIRNLQNVSRY